MITTEPLPLILLEAGLSYDVINIYSTSVLLLLAKLF